MYPALEMTTSMMLPVSASTALTVEMTDASSPTSISMTLRRSETPAVAAAFCSASALARERTDA